MAEISIQEWIGKLVTGEFNDPDKLTQIKAGWYDWFCRDTALVNKTKRMGGIIKQLRVGGKVDLQNWYVWFKNNCPLNGPLFDDFRFAQRTSGETMLTIQIDCCWNKCKYTVYGRQPTENGWTTFFDNPLFESDSSYALVCWLNSPWKK